MKSSGSVQSANEFRFSEVEVRKTNSTESGTNLFKRKSNLFLPTDCFMDKILLKPKFFSISLTVVCLFLNIGVFSQSQTFNSSGTFTVPVGVTSVTVKAWGGGGGGRSGNGSTGGGGGGGAAYVSGTLSNLTAGATISVTVGAAGAVNGGNGTASIVSTFSAGGGGAGTVGAGGAAGTANGGTTNTPGSPGTSSAGGDAGNITGGGGTGGTVGNGANGNGNVGGTPGGGGGGSGKSGSGAAGGPGRVIISWTCPTVTSLSYPSQICKTSTSSSPTTVGTAGGTYTSSPAGLSIDANTGIINASLSTAGTYTVTYGFAAQTGYTSNCPASSATSTVTIVAAAPSQPSTITGATSPCISSSQIYSVTNVAGVTYTWSFPPGWSQTAGGSTNSVTVTVGSGAGDITVTPSNACGNGTPQTLTVTISPNNTVGTASSSPTVCFNTALTPITHTTTGATGIGTPTGLPAGVTAVWTSNAITISGTPSTSASGTFNYSIPLTGGCGNVNATGTIIVRAQFTAGTISNTGQTICYNSSPSATIGSATAASGGDNTLTYQWQISTDNTFTTGVTTINSNTATYLPTGPLTTTTYYRRQAKDATCNTTFTSSSNIWAITVRPAFTAGAISTTGQTICSGGTPSSIGSSTPASGGDNAMTYSWRSSADGYVAAIPGATSATYTPPAGLTTTTSYQRYAKDGTCITTPTQSTGTWTVTVRPAFTTGAIGTTGETICSGGDPSLIGSATVASGGDNSITYQWQANGVNIPGANSATYDPPSGLTATTTYTRFAKDGACNTTFTQSTGSWVVTVRSEFTTGAINSTGEIVCYGAAPGAIGSTTVASGGDGVITYKWTANGVDVPNSNSATYTPPVVQNIAVTYRRFTKDNSCNTDFMASAGSWTISSLPQFQSGAINTAGETMCHNGDPVVISSAVDASGSDGTIVYKWQANGQDIPNSNTPRYNPGRLTTTTTFKRFAKSSLCSDFAPSDGEYVVTVRQQTGQITLTAGTPDACGNIVFTASESTNYQWYRHDLPIQGATGREYTVIQDGHYTVRTTTAEGCIATSALRSVSGINPVVTKGVQDECGRVTLTASAGAEYQWYRHGVEIKNATAASYTAQQDGHYAVRVTKANGCVKTSFVSIVEKINPVVIVGTPDNCGNVTLIAPAGTNYQWYRHGVLISGATERNYTATQNGNYQVRMTLGAGCTATSAYAVIRSINPEITVTSSSCESVTLTASSGSNYQWYRHGVLISGATERNYTATKAGNYQVRVTTVNGCTALSGYAVITFSPCAFATVNPSVSDLNKLNEIESKSSLAITAYPNPSSSQFSVTLTSLDEKSEISVSVYDQMGRMVDVRKGLFSGQVVKLGTSYKTGTYFIQMVQGLDRKSIQVVKVN